MSFLTELKGPFVVSCQALEDEPLHSSEIMAKMAIAAEMGGANGIRANSVSDINAIKQAVDLPVVGILKRDYDDSDVFITATKTELDELFTSSVDMIALDATGRPRPNGETLTDLVRYAKETRPDIELMADVSSVEEAVAAEQLGFDCVSTTLIGYTKETAGQSLFDDDFRRLKEMKQQLSIPVVAEGKLNTPELAKEALENGADFVVVGSAITRPQLIAARFKEVIDTRHNG